MKLTNRELLIAALLDGVNDKERTMKRVLSVDLDDGGATEEMMVHYHVNCPYSYEKDCMLKKNEEPNGITCTRCKFKWLNKKVSD